MWLWLSLFIQYLRNSYFVCTTQYFRIVDFLVWSLSLLILLFWLTLQNCTAYVLYVNCNKIVQNVTRIFNMEVEKCTRNCTVEKKFVFYYISYSRTGFCTHFQFKHQRFTIPFIKSFLKLTFVEVVFCLEKSICITNSSRKYS